MPSPRQKWNWPLIGIASLLALVAARPYAASWNDGSRLATVEALVDHHTLAIDRSIFVDVPTEGPSPYPDSIPVLKLGTQDKLFIDGHWYSDKSPLPALFLALVYWTLQSLTGLVAAQDPGTFCFWMTLANSGLAYVLAVACVDRMAAILELDARQRWLLVGSFALGSIALIYTQHVNNHILFLGLAALVTLQLVQLAKDGIASWPRMLLLGAAAGLAYSADLGVGPPLIVTLLGVIVWRTGSGMSVAKFLLGAGPWLILHHAVNYAVGGALKPANAVPEYLAWPGSPFSAETMTGQLNHPSVFHFFAYAAQMLVGKQGFLFHNLATLLVLPAAFRLWRTRNDAVAYRPEVVWALAWCALGWLAYAATSNNYSGGCLSIRWFVPLLAPLYLVIAVGLRAGVIALRELAVLTGAGVVLMALAWWNGPWTLRMVPGYWIVAAGALIAWGMVARRSERQQCQTPKRLAA